VDVVVVLVLAVLAGVGVYLATMRWSPGATTLPGEGFLPEEEDLQAQALQAAAPLARSGATQSYVPLASGRRSMQTRLLGLLGIVVLVPITAIAFALATYAAGRVLVEAISRLIEKAIA
jgi:hypothetical protein